MPFCLFTRSKPASTGPSFQTMVLLAQRQRVRLGDKCKAQFNSQCKYTVQGNYTQFTALQTMPLCITVWNWACTIILVHTLTPQICRIPPRIISLIPHVKWLYVETGPYDAARPIAGVGPIHRQPSTSWGLFQSCFFDWVSPIHTLPWTWKESEFNQRQAQRQAHYVQEAKLNTCLLSRLGFLQYHWAFQLFQSNYGWSILAFTQSKGVYSSWSQSQKTYL